MDLIDAMTNRNVKSVGKCIKFVSHKICVAGNQCDNSDFDFHNVEHKELPVIKICCSEGRDDCQQSKPKRNSGFLWNYRDNINNSSYSFNFV